MQLAKETINIKAILKRGSQNNQKHIIRSLFFFFLFRATPVGYGDSQVKAQIRAIASGLHHSHINAGTEPCLQLMATPDP